MDNDNGETGWGRELKVEKMKNRGGFGQCKWLCDEPEV
ncbi:hypothetical protein A2U01_0023352, partial [Trifolium medium]|nr:hypothetical protein [Trifolium medium]